MATSRPSNDRIDSPRKATVAASILFGAKGKAPVTGHHAARSEETLGEDISVIVANSTIIILTCR